MGDKDFLKDVLKHLDFTLHFGRVNMKPGWVPPNLDRNRFFNPNFTFSKPMTFATNPKGNFVFGLPGNPVSAYVTYHLFVLPTLRKYCGYSDAKTTLPAITVEVPPENIDS